jgi:hypothetical protein
MLDSDLRALYSWMVRYTGALRGSETPRLRRLYYIGKALPSAGFPTGVNWLSSANEKTQGTIVFPLR